MPSQLPTPGFVDLPQGLSGDQLIQALNDRLRRLAQSIGQRGTQQPGDINMAEFRIVALGDAINAQDALNLRMADKRYTAIGQATPAQVDAGASTPTTGTLVLTVPGVLAIESSATPLISFPTLRSFRNASVLVKQAPLGAPIALRVSAGGWELGRIAVADGSAAEAARVTWDVPQGAVVTVDLVSVGLVFPGADLTLQLWS